MTIQEAFDALKRFNQTQSGVGAWLDYIEDEGFYEPLLRLLRREFEVLSDPYSVMMIILEMWIKMVNTNDRRCLEWHKK